MGKMQGMRGGTVLAATVLLVLLGAGAGAEDRPRDREIGEIQVYLTPEGALEEIFENVAGVDTIRVVLEEEDLTFLTATLGRPAVTDRITIFLPRDEDGALLGYAVIDEEVGKYRPITFMVGTTPEGEVKNVEVLVYRESRGGDVRRGRFLRQYRGKAADDPIRSHQDIINIAGATLSVNALNLGVKRVLLTLELLAERGIL
jgi:hypothetical protein